MKIFTGSIALGERIENGRCCRTLRNSRIDLAKGYLDRLQKNPFYVGRLLWEDKSPRSSDTASPGSARVSLFETWFAYCRVTLVVKLVRASLIHSEEWQAEELQIETSIYNLKTAGSTDMSNPALDHARHIIARERGFSSWRKLKEHIENLRR